MKDDNIKNRIMACKAEAEAAWNDWRAQAKEDFQMAMGDQWEQAVLSELATKNAPALTVNLIMKQINIVSGLERQGRGDLKVLPIEGGDEDQAEVLSMLMKWIMADRNAEFIRSDAFKDALICGMGWLYTYIQFDDDPRNGDINLKKISPFNMLPDPSMVERDLSDCRYLIHFKKIWKDDCIRLYPEHKKDLERLKGGDTQNQFDLSTISPSDLGEKLEVIEFWHRRIEKVTYIMDSMKQEDMQRWPGKKKELKEFLAANPTFVAIEREVQQMRLATLVEGQVLVYDDVSPYEGNDYPFTPIFCFYFSAYDEWKWKVQGLIRGLKDIQREKNKRRSVIMQAFGMMPHAYWLYEKGAIDNEAVLQEAAGIGKKIKVNPGKMGAVQAVQGPEIPQSAIVLEQMNNDDITMVGANPDLLGQMLEKGAPGIAIKLRREQGLTVLQEIFDSNGYSGIVMGRKIIYLLTNNWSIDKIKRIIGRDFYYTKKIMELSQQLQQIVSTPVRPVDIPAEWSPADEQAHMLASDGAKEVIEHDILADKNAREMEVVRMQYEDKKNSAYAVKMQLDQTVQAEREFWVNFEKAKREARYDCKVEESASSPTYRYQIMSTLMEFGRNGLLAGPLPLEIVLDLMSELPRALREKWVGLVSQQQQMMMMQGGRR